MCINPFLYSPNASSVNKFISIKSFVKHFPYLRFKLYDLYADVDSFVVPCGSCVKCMMKRSTHWAVRCCHEASLFRNNCFITLTYDDKHIPPDRMLYKKPFQLFMKRLRFEFSGCESYEFEGKVISPIRYFACGEYAPKHNRPHFHAILFNFQFSELEFYKRSWGNTLYTSPVLERLWPFGYSTIGAVTFSSSSYVSRYIFDKKAKKNLPPCPNLHLLIEEDVKFFVDDGQPLCGCHRSTSDKDYGVCKVAREFVVMSNRPGIGYRWIVKNFPDVYNHDRCVFLTNKAKTSRSISPPRYYDKILERIYPEWYETIKSKRVENVQNIDQFSDDAVSRREISGEFLQNYIDKKIKKIKKI